MKTVMKKLLSLALVAILLVSAVPFQAAAAEDQGNVAVDVYLDDAHLDTRSLLVTEGTVLDEATGKSLLNFPDQYDFVRWENNSGVTVTDKPLPYSWVKTQTGYSLVLYIKTKAVPHTHAYELTDKKAATCTTDGYETYTCKNTDGKCDNLSYTNPIKADGVSHIWGEWTEQDGKQIRSCTEKGCDATQSGKYVVKFVADGVTIATKTVNEGDMLDPLPTPNEKTGYDFYAWYTGPNGTGVKLDSSTGWDGKTLTYYAKYKENASGDKDGKSYLTVRMRVYVGSKYVNEEILLNKVELDDNTKIAQWLVKNEQKISDEIFSKLDKDEYEWVDREYFFNDTSAKLTPMDTVADGDKVVFTKVHAIASTETNVQLYIHKYDTKNEVYNTLKIVDVSGYKAGSTITLNAMKDVVKKYYTFKTITGLYTESTWKQMVAGQKPTPSTSYEVDEGVTVKYHVLLDSTAAPKSGTTSKADTTNPKTGDMILVPAMVMLASAAAVAFVYISSKKRAVR